MPDDSRKNLANNDYPKFPTGSGWFAAICGGPFGVTSFVPWCVGLTETSHKVMMMIWFILAGAVLLIWGINRITTGQKSRIIGQDTINLVLTAIGATVGLLSLFMPK